MLKWKQAPPPFQQIKDEPDVGMVGLQREA